MNNIHIQRKRLLKTKLNYIKKLNRSGIDISLSSLSSFSRLMFAGVGKTLDQIDYKNFEKKINLTNFIYQIKNFLRILKLRNVEIIGNYSKNNINIYDYQRRNILNVVLYVSSTLINCYKHQSLRNVLKLN